MKFNPELAEHHVEIVLLVLPHSSPIWYAGKKSQKDAVSDTSSCQKTLQVAAHAKGRTCSPGRESHTSRTQTTLKRANSFSDTERSGDKSFSARKTYRSVINTIWGYLRFSRLAFLYQTNMFCLSVHKFWTQSFLLTLTGMATHGRGKLGTAQLHPPKSGSSELLWQDKNLQEFWEQE